MKRKTDLRRIPFPRGPHSRPDPKPDEKMLKNRLQKARARAEFQNACRFIPAAQYPPDPAA